jgi:uncharacterized membrane protein
LVIAAVAFFHLAAGLIKPHMGAMATAFNAVGTVTSFAAVALVGQIFNIQEHWPAGVMLCALCALAGWWLLRDQMQQTLTLLLFPIWLICEWTDRARQYHGQDVYLYRMILVLAIFYMAAFIHSRRRVMSGILFAAAVVVIPSMGECLSEGWQWLGWRNQNMHFLPLCIQLAAWAFIVAIILITAVRFRFALLPVLVVAIASILMPYAHTTVMRHDVAGNAVYSYPQTTTNIYAYLLGALVAICLAWWGTKQASKRTINYAIVLFAVVVAWFFFSSIMDKLDRSFSLMLMGIVFLVGGWFLEKFRRRLIGSISSREVTA